MLLNLALMLDRGGHGLFHCRPRPLGGGEPDQPALDVVAAPFAQHHGSLLVLHPFGHRLDVEPAGEVDQRLHESTVVGGARDVLHERAVDFHDVHAELAQIAERGVAGAEIVDRDFAAEVLQPRDEASGMVDVLARPVSVISTSSRSATPGWLRISDSMVAVQSGSMVVSGEMLRLSRTLGEAISSATTSSRMR